MFFSIVQAIIASFAHSLHIGCTYFIFWRTILM